MKTEITNNAPVGQSSNPIIHQSPRLFNQPGILEQIGHGRVAKFLNGFEADLKLSCPGLLSAINGESSGQSLAEVAKLMTSTKTLPDSLKYAMFTLETAAAPENGDRLDALIQHHIPNVSLNRSCPLDCALEIWFVAPAELASFKAQSSTVQSSAVGISCKPRGTPNNQPLTTGQLPDRGTSPARSSLEPTIGIGHPASHEPSLTTDNGFLAINHKQPTTDNPGADEKYAQELFHSHSILSLEDVKPFPEPVDGKTLLDAIVAMLRQFLVLPRWAAETLALWVLHTYLFKTRDVTTYIGIESPEKRCGKTTLLTVLSELVNRPVVSTNISSPAFFRVIEEVQPTLLIDEADTFFQGNHELRGILNSGYKRKTSFVVRVSHELPTAPANGNNSLSSIASRLVRFSCWCPKVMAAIGRFPDTLADRCILIRMQRKTMKEECERLRNLETTTLRQQCARFALDNAKAVASARPELPSSLNDRAADIWEPLLAIADLAGGDWPQLARQGAVSLCASAQDHNPIGSLLLDIFLLFTVSKTSRLFSRELVQSLNTFPDRPWGELRKGKPITELWLAQQLRPYGVRPKTIWIHDVHAKGYSEEEFHDVFRRYIPRSELDALRAECDPQDQRNGKQQGGTSTGQNSASQGPGPHPTPPAP